MSLAPLRLFWQVTPALTALVVLIGVSGPAARAQNRSVPASPPVVVTRRVLDDNTEQFVFTIGDRVAILTADKILPLLRGTILSSSDQRTLRVVGDTPTYSLSGNFRLILPNGSTYYGKDGVVSFAEGPAAPWLTLYPLHGMRRSHTVKDSAGKVTVEDTDFNIDWVGYTLSPPQEAMQQSSHGEPASRRKAVSGRPLLWKLVKPESQTSAAPTGAGVLGELTYPEAIPAFGTIPWLP